MLVLGAAIAATTVVAYAQTEERHEERQMIIRHGGAHERMDADNDGWITRAESSAAAERIFAELDRNHDGRLDTSDRPPMEDFDVRVMAPGDAPMAEGDNCDRTETNENGQRRVTVICRDDAEHAEGEHREVHRHVIVRHADGEEHGELVPPTPPVPPVAPLPPHPPMFMFLMGEDSEADLNNDGALSLDEFRNQHLRMFDAQDINGDGRIRAPRMPEPPTPPAPPAPPSPPSRG
jgi:hypothetical protein